MKGDKLLLCILSVLLNIKIVLSYNILVALPYQGKSHFVVFEPYLKELARRGHNLTVISHFPQEQHIENYHDISLAGKMKSIHGSFPIDRSYWSIIQTVLFLYDNGRESCKTMLADEEVQRLWQSNAHFDLVVTEQFNSDCSLGLAYKLGAPVMGINSHPLMPWHFERFGIHYNPSYIPFQFLEGGTNPTLYQRMERTIFQYVVTTFYKYVVLEANEKELQRYFDTAPLENLTRNIKLMLLYTHNVLHGSQTRPSNVIEVGGYHVDKPKKLPKELKKFIEESKHGVIYVSFGTMLQASSIPKDKLKAIIEVLAELPQRVIWKWDEKNLPGDPKNIYINHWFPQNDILAHSKTVAFFSHCGMLSTTEAIHHGVPIIGMPIFGDQPVNAAAAEESGLGVQLQLRDLTKKTLSQKMNTVLDPE